jgi:hypothetical protein
MVETSIQAAKEAASGKEPVVISFFGGDAYYFQAAAQLRADCRDLGLDHDIVEVPVEPGETWVDLCRKKVQFYRQMLQLHARPILWLDVDCRLVKRPDFLDAAGIDIAAFVRGFRYIRDFDPQALSRFFTPSILFFNNTERTAAFLEFMCEIESQSTVRATDDYFLQEAWQRFDQQLSVLLLRPDLVSTTWPAPQGCFFYFGSSGRVSQFKSDAAQHKIELYTPRRRKAVLLNEARIVKDRDERLVFLRRAFALDPKDEAMAYRVARALRDKGDLKGALVVLRRFQGKAPEIDHARRFLADSELESGNVTRAIAIARELRRSVSPQDQAWAAGRLLRLALEERALKRGLKDADRPALWWMETPYPGNFGDILNPYIVEKLTGVPPRLSQQGRGILAIGSVIKFATDKSIVWGSGTPRLGDPVDPRARFLAVRGPLTRQLVVSNGGSCPEIFGDPAWFLPRIYRPRPAQTRHELGLILHHSNMGDLRVGEGVKAISVLCEGYQGIEAFIDQVNSCERVMTTSLHGLIVCHAYGIPALWCEVVKDAAGVPGDGTKFRDYLLSVGLDACEPVRLPRNAEITLADVKRDFTLPARQIDLEALVAAAPFKVRPDWSTLYNSSQSQSSSSQAHPVRRLFFWR